MSDEPLDQSGMLAAWRFSLVLTGCADGAAAAFPAAVAEVLRHPDTDDTRRAHCLFLSALRRRSLKFPARCEWEGLPAQVHQMPEPGRSALILRALGGISGDEIGRVLALDRKELAGALNKVQAVWAEGKPEDQSADEVLSRELSALPISSAGEAAIEAAVEEFASHQKGHRPSVRNPAFFAVGFAFVLLAGVLVWHFLESASAFPEEAGKIGLLGDKVRADQFEPVETKVGGLADWLVMKGVDRFYVPPEFENFTAVGLRIFREEGEAVVQIAVAENVMFFYIFPGAPFGVDLPPGTWRVLESGKRVTAITQENGLCFMVAFDGDKEDWQALLEQARSGTR